MHLRAVPLAVVTGKVVDAEGEPLPDAQVHAIRATWHSGKRAYEASGAALANERGEFRLFGLEPGRYRLCVNPPTSNALRLSVAEGPEQPEFHLASVYYSSGRDLAGAAPVDLAAGQELGGIELKLPMLPSFHVRGKTEAGLNDWGGMPAFVQLVRMAPGRYHVIAQRTGYLDQAYGARPGGREGEFRVNADRPVGNADIKLVPRAVLSGTVLHAAGQPAARTEVTVLERVPTSHGPDQDSVESDDTDDRGIFRFADLAPGTYYLSAQPQPPYEHFSFEFLDNLGRHANEKEALTYFPAAAGFASARPIVLKAGQEVSGLAITLRNSPLRHLSGRANGGTAGMVVELDAQSEGLRNMAISVKPDGSFESSNALPGKYDLEVRAAGEGVVAVREVDLTDGDLEGLVLAPQETLTVPLALQTEDSAPPVRPGQFLIMLGAVTSKSESMAQTTAAGDPEFRHVLPGTYRLDVNTHGMPYYLKRVMLNGEAQPPERIDLRARPDAPMELIFSPNVAKIEGRTGEPPAEGVTVLLVESGRPEDDSDERHTWSDRDGAFHFDGVKPGKYRLFAIEGFDDGPWCPELAAALHSAPVEVGEKETRQVTVPLVRVAEWNAAVERFGQ